MIKTVEKKGTLNEIKRREKETEQINDQDFKKSKKKKNRKKEMVSNKRKKEIVI